MKEIIKDNLLKVLKKAIADCEEEIQLGGRIPCDLSSMKKAVEEAEIQPAPVQEPAAEILSDVIHRNAKKLVFTHHGLSLPVGTKLYTATQPAPVQEPTRFDLDMDGSMEPSEFGEWVRYEDI